MMKRIPFILSLILASSLFSFIFASWVSANNEIKLGVFYYPWYDGRGYHCNGHPNEYGINLTDTWWRVIDVPVLGNTSNSTYCMYASDNVTVIKQHLDWFRDTGIDFGIISWWGPNSFEDNHTDILFNVTSSYAPWFKWVISMEGGEPENWAFFRNWVYENYTKKYPQIWLNDPKENKPFLFWMNSDMTNDNSTRQSIEADHDFSVRILGQANYSDWKTWTPYTDSGSTSTFPPSQSEFMCVMPRYDETGLAPNRIRCADKYLNGSDWETVDPVK